ncbi:hypothetical protein RD792_000848 [Penstemon davidsonii]|uniref:WAT1-related protein n=1 Tax=Penstemon davidsonii TaxID=160366 RepID=A0ABR0DMK1_9LAMI|nr:hypothetical protein RD792_000848 [Penstemon davidsonii]
MIFVQFSYAGMALFSKAAISRGMNPYVFVAYRQAFAVFALAPFAFFLERKRAEYPLTYSLMWKIFLVSLFGITLSLNLYTYALNYVSATFASASVNTIPALTFLISVMFRIESFSIRNLPGITKCVGLVVSLSGAMVFAFVKGPQVNFMNWSTAVQTTNNSSVSTLQHFSNKEVMKGCLLMLSANAAWASWLVMQGVVVTGISYWLQVWAVEDKGPLFTSTFTPLALIITAIISAFLWKEMLHLGSICGGMLLVGGLYCVLWGRNKEAEIEANKEKPDSKDEITIV